MDVVQPASASLSEPELAGYRFIVPYDPGGCSSVSPSELLRGSFGEAGAPAFCGPGEGVLASALALDKDERLEQEITLARLALHVVHPITLLEAESACEVEPSHRA